MWGNKENYLAAALNVVYGVKDKVPFGASNRLSDFVESYDRHHKKVEGANPNVFDKFMGGMTAFLPLMTGANILQTKWGCPTATAEFGVA